MATETKGRAPDFRAFTVKGEGDDAWWTRIGSAWANKSGGFNIQLDALPIDGKIVLMPPKEEEEEPPAKKSGKR